MALVLHRSASAVRSLLLPAAALFAFAVAAFPFTGPALSAQELLLTDGKFVDPDDGSVFEGHLLLGDGVVQARLSAVPEGYSGEMVDLEGRYVIPGLHDMHTHSFGNSGPGGVSQFAGVGGVANLMLYSGVVAFLDLFSVEDQILGARDRQRSQGLGGAEILAAGPCLTATAGHCSEYGVPTRIVDTPEDARREVTALATKRPDVVKIVYDHRSRMPTVDKSTLRETAETSSAELRDAYRNRSEWDDRTNGFMEWQLQGRDDFGPSLRALHEAGVTILTGTDAGNLGVFQGYSVHREIALLVEAGLPPLAALAAATTAAGRFLGRSVGVNVGDAASFTVLDGSPLADLGNTTRIHLVILHGRVIDRAGLL